MSEKDKQRYVISILLSKTTTYITHCQLKDLIRYNLLALLLGCLGGVRGEKKKCKKGPGVKQIDGSVVSWKPEHIALSTAAFDSLPKSGRKLKLHSRTGLKSHEDIQKGYQTSILPVVYNKSR